MTLASLPSNLHNAFTLIELLVVIAILAILAAILFPVFSRAKLAAKGSASLSNAKRIAISSMLDSCDYDDHFILGGQWHAHDQRELDILDRSGWYMPWTGLTELYLKNRDILVSPKRLLPIHIFIRRNPTFGYSTNYLSSFVGRHTKLYPQVSSITLAPFELANGKYRWNPRK